MIDEATLRAMQIAQELGVKMPRQEPELPAQILDVRGNYDPFSAAQIAPAPTGIPASWGPSIPGLDERIQAGAEFSPFAKLLDFLGVLQPVRQATQGIPLISGIFDPSPQMAEIPNVFHGSPYRFSKFDMAKVGTGEGAQSFGHGLYFTNQKDIAQHYQKKLAAKPFNSLTEKMQAITIDGKPLTQKYDIDNIEWMVDFAKKRDADSILSYSQQSLDRWKELMADPKYKFHDYAVDKVNAYEGLIKELKSGAKVEYPTGSTYTATLMPGKKPDDYAFMDWYEPIPKSEKLKSGLKSIGFEDWQIDSMMNRLNGEGLYQSLAAHFGMGGRDIVGKQKASAFLKQQGIDGIRYPTETLSGKGTKGGGGYNYVVFDDKDIKITGIE